MSDEQTPELKQDELQTLKDRADKLGIKYHPSVGVDTLKERINAKLAGDAAEDKAPAQAPTTESENQFRLRKRKEASELVRIQVTCMNPNKGEWEGEFFCAGNSVIGTYKRYVPFNVEWHVERVIYNQIVAKQCQIFATRRDDRGRQIREGKLIREFNVAVLPPLTQEELKDLAQRQAMANGTSQ